MKRSRSSLKESPSSLPTISVKSTSRSQRAARPSTRRGRPSRDDYVRQVVPLIRADVWKLDECSAFAAYPAVRALAKQYRREILPMGKAMKCLIDRAVGDVIALGAVLSGTQSDRVATFLRLWYREERTVAAIARQLDLERTHVAKTVQRPALELVARRFLDLAEQTDPTAERVLEPSNARRTIA
jgi:hypothetical protein